MSTTSTLRRRLGTGMLAIGLGAGVLLAAQPAEALRSEVCVAWTSSGYGYIDDNGNDIYVVEARCSMWMSTGDGPVDPPPGGDEGTIPKGASPGGTDDPKAEHCEFLKQQLAERRAALEWAQNGVQAAEDEVDKWNFKSAVDHARYTDAHEEYVRALSTLEYVKAQYAEENDTELEVETRNGNTVAISLAVDPRKTWGEEVIEAQAQLDRARKAERAAWETWSQYSDPAAQEAQRLLDAMYQVLATAPMAIEALQRDLNQDC